MAVVLQKSTDRVREAMALARRSLMESSYDTLKMNILEKYRFETLDVASAMDQRTAIVCRFQRDFAKAREEIAFYFERRESGIYLANFLVKLPDVQVTNRRLKCSRSIAHKPEQFVVALRKLELIDEQVGKEIHDYEGLVALFEKIDLSGELKWLFQTLYLHLEAYLKRLGRLIGEIVDWLAQFQTELTYEERIFAGYWGEFLKTHDFREHLATKLNMRVPDSIEEIEVVPAYFDCNLIFNEVTHPGHMKVYLGMIFDKSFSLEQKYETVSMLCSHLKLLSDISKFEILRMIKGKACYGSELAKAFNLSTPTISHHMQALENAGFVKTEKRYNRTYYSLDEDRLNLFMRQICHILLEKEGK